MRKILVFALALAFGLPLAAVRAQQTSADKPRYTNGNNLIRPTDYREWPFLGSSLGLTYKPQTEGGAPRFSNVFVNPSSYRVFMQTGKWPDGTVLILELRRSKDDGVLIKGGRYQSDLMALEANVKDSRFQDGWAFYSWGGGNALKDAAPPESPNSEVPGEGTCVACHTTHAAVERTFVQFYPTLLDVARQKGTLNPGF